MQVFVTGGTGTIGSAVVAELLGHGHTVLALARSDSSEQTLTGAGADVLRGGLADLDLLRAGAAQSDGVISLAFGRDYSTAEAVGQGETRRAPPWPRWEQRSSAATADRHGLRDALGAGPRLHRGRLLPTDGPVGGRGLSVMALLDLAPRGVRATAVWMPRTVHNDGRGGFAGLLTDQARRTRGVRLPRRRHPALAGRPRPRRSRPVPPGPGIGTGRNGLARRRRRGRRGTRHRDSHRPATWPAGPARAGGKLWSIRPIFAMDQPASSAHTRNALSWQPTYPSLLDDLENVQP